MTTQEKLNVIVNVLNRQANPTSMGELLQLLGPPYVERSVRRWLNELVTQGYVTKTGNTRNARYQITKARTTDEIFSPNALSALQLVRQPLFKRNPVSYNSEWISGYHPNKTFYLSETMRRNMSAQGRRQHDNDPAGTYARKVYNRLLIDLTYNSSRLEGNTYSLLETERLVLEGATAEGKMNMEKVMILNHKEAIRHIIDVAPKLQIETDEICTIHYLLSDGLVERKYAGKVRDHEVRIGGSTYSPFNDNFRLEQQLTKICSLADEITDPFEQSFFILVHISYLQAFIDVNKRTARISANIPFIKNNFVPLSFNDIEKDDYNSAMICVYELNQTLPLAELYYYSYFRSCQQYTTATISLGFDRIRVQYRKQRRDLIQQVILKCLIGSDVTQFIKQQANILIEKNDAEAFINMILQDLDDVTLPRLAGMGITRAQLQAWLKSNGK